MSKFKVGDEVQVSGGFGKGVIEGFVPDGTVVLRDDSGRTGFATVEELRLVKWTTLAELRPGAVFETEDGERGCKLEPRTEFARYARLKDGSVRVVAHDKSQVLKVRELSIP